MSESTEHTVTACYLLHSHSLLSTHADGQGVDISVTVCLFVCFFVILFVCLYGYGFLCRG